MTKMKKLFPAVTIVAFPMLALFGCGVGGTTPDPGGGADAAVSMVECSTVTGTPSVQVGGGSSQTGFVDLPDGAEMVGVLGPQGLYMVTPSIRAHGVYPGEDGRAGHPDDPVVLVETFEGSTLVGGSASEHLGLTNTAAGYERYGIFVPFTGDLSEYVGKTVTLKATVTDACDNTATDELQILVQQ